MSRFTGMAAEDAEQVLNDLHLGIDVGKKLVTATHQLDDKLASLYILMNHITMEYPEEITDFLEKIIVESHDFVPELKKFESEELHLVLLESAAEAVGPRWIFSHRAKVEAELKEESKVVKKHLQHVHKYLLIIQKEFVEAKHLFLVDIEKCKITEMRIDLVGKEKEFEHIIENLLLFLKVYLHLLESKLKEMK